MGIKKRLGIMAMAAVTVSSAMAQQPVDYVNPIIGTNGMGHTFPGACTPFGWVQLSPDTDTIPIRRTPMSIAPVINIVIRQLWVLAIHTLAEPDIRTWAIFY